jgi:hypothetical protein
MMPCRCLISLCLLLGPVWLLGGDPAPGLLHCTQPEVRLGEVRAGVPLSRAFELVNRGREAIDITAVLPSCGCLTLKLARRQLQPGEAATLRLDMNTLTQPAGPQTWRIRVRYQHGAQLGELELALSAKVVTEVTVEPAALVVYTNSPLSSTVTLRDHRPKPIKLIGASTTSPHVTATLAAQHREESGDWIQPVSLRIGPDFPEGRHNHMLSLFTADRDYHELRVPFTVVKHARPHVTAAPSSVSVLLSRGQAPPARIILLRGSGDEEVKVLGADGDHPAILCTWASGPGPLATLKVAFDRAKLPADGLQGTVTVRLSGPPAETVTIPVVCTLR